MKNSRVCPKCRSTDILIRDGSCGAYGVGNNVMLGATVFSAVMVDRYICCTCGYTEEWIRREDMEKLKKSSKCHR